MQISELLQQYQNRLAAGTQMQEGVTVPKNVSSAQLLESLLNLGNLKIGDVIEGSILKSTKDTYTILLANGKQLEAKLDLKSNTAFELLDKQLSSTESKSMFFQIKSAVNNTLQLRPILSPEGGNPRITQALTAAGLPVNEKNVAIVQNRMDASLPVDANSLKEMAKQLALNPTVSVATAVAMERAGIPITEEMAASFENYQTDAHKILTQIESLMNQITEELNGSLEEKQVKNTPVQSDALQYTKVPVDDSIAEQLEDIQLMSKTAEKNAQVAALEPLQKEIIAVSVDETEYSKTLPDKIKIVLQFISEDLPENLKDAIVKNPAQIREILSQEWMLKPEEFTKEEVAKLYDRLLEQTEAVKSALDAAGRNTQSLESLTSSIRQNVDFMQQIQQLYPYVQVPLKMNGRESNAELYVYTNKRNGATEDGELSAFLHLDLDYLGSTDVSVKMKDMQVSTKFYMDNEKAAELLAQNLDKLNKRLEEKGYQSQITVTNEEDQKDIITRMFGEPVESTGTLHRYSFDVMA